jgi:hypothetical protein
VTVNVELPYVRYVGNAVTTSFAFVWSSDDDNEIYVQRTIGTADPEILEVGVDYELEGYTEDFGGQIIFAEPPTADTVLLIYRQTPVTQQVDYVDSSPFPADTHENQMDKDTRILQEIINAGRGGSGIVDLDSIEKPAEVEITNTSGANAQVPLWNCNADLAGAYAGEVTLSAPADQSQTTKPDGYIWLEVASF